MLVPFSPIELSAMRMLCKPVGVALEVLDPSASDHLKNERDGRDDPIKRAQALSTELRSFLVNMARGREELGVESHDRLESEAVGLLIALRELHRHFPELRGKIG